MQDVRALLCQRAGERWQNAPQGCTGNPGAAGAGAAGGSYEANTVNGQSDRCGKLCYDCVYKLAQMINSFMSGGTFTAVLDPSVASCTPSGCHGTNAATGHPYVDSKMKCTSCHDERIGDNHNL